MESKEIAVKDQQVQALTLADIKKYICPLATDQEAYMFLQLCKAQNLNPFLREAYLIKYGSAPATIVTGKETFTKRADRLPQFDGFKAGVILQSGDKIQYREGSFVISGEILLGGWAEVYRKDRSIPFRNEVLLEEYIGKKSDGTINKMWREKTATMIRKVPLMQSLREAFPDEFGGMYSPEEMPIDSGNLPVYEHGREVALQHPEIIPPQSKSGTQPTDGKVISTPQAKRFYAIAKSAGWQDAGLKQWLIDNYNIDSTKNIKVSDYDAICEAVKTPPMPDPEGCTKNPVTCDTSIWDGAGKDAKPSCEGGKCKYVKI